jgi:hypothetical protein
MLPNNNIGRRIMSEELVREDGMANRNEVNNDVHRWEPLNDGCLLPLLNEYAEKLERRPTLLSPRIRIPVTHAEMELCAAERDQLLQDEADTADREYRMHRRIFSPRQTTSHFLPQATLPNVFAPTVPKGITTFSRGHPTSHFLPQATLPTIFVPTVPKGVDTAVHGQYCFLEQTGVPVMNHYQDFLVVGENHNAESEDIVEDIFEMEL